MSVLSQATCNSICEFGQSNRKYILTIKFNAFTFILDFEWQRDQLCAFLNINISAGLLSPERGMMKKNKAGLSMPMLLFWYSSE